MVWRATQDERIVRRTVTKTMITTQTRYGLMRLTRLPGMNEVRRPTVSETQANRRPSLFQTGKHCWDRDAWSDWRRNVQKRMFVNQGYLTRCCKERVRSQSPHSSDEAANHRGAKEGRKVEA
jgi:hypothetical protein